MPVPASEAVCGLLDAPSVTVSVSVSPPVMLGVNVIEMVQVKLAGTLTPHVLVWAKSPLATMLEMASAVSRLLVAVMIFAALVVYSACLPKLSEAGARVTGITPVPASEAVCGLLDAPSVTVKVPVSAPVMLGVNVTEMVQLELAATLLPHVLVSAKSPLAMMLEMERAEFRLLVKVTVFAALVVYSACLPKPSEAGLSLACTMPVPDSATLCGLFAALSATLTEAVSAPVWLGVNVTAMVHLAAGARLVGQLLV